MIQVENASLCFYENTPAERRVLSDINLQIRAGDFITLVGSNGAGKSSLLKILSGLYSPTKGRVLFNSELLSSLTLGERAARMAYVHQDPRQGCIDSLSIEENMVFAYSRGKTRGARLALRRHVSLECRELLAQFNTGLENQFHEKVSILSGGQRQVLSLVMATLQTPEVLLLDEHTAALDPRAAERVLEITDHLIQAKNMTAVMITHQLADALAFGNRCLVLSEGRIVRDYSHAAMKSLDINTLLTSYTPPLGSTPDKDEIYSLTD